MEWRLLRDFDETLKGDIFCCLESYVLCGFDSQESSHRQDATSCNLGRRSFQPSLKVAGAMAAGLISLFDYYIRFHTFTNHRAYKNLKL